MQEDNPVAYKNPGIALPYRLQAAVDPEAAGILARFQEMKPLLNKPEVTLQMREATFVGGLFE